MHNIDDDIESFDEDFLEEDIDFDIPSIDLVDDDSDELPNDRLEIKGVTSQEESDYMLSMFSKQSATSLPIYLVLEGDRHKIGYAELDYSIFLTLRNIRDSYTVTLISGDNRKDIINPTLSDEDILENLFLFIKAR